MNSKRDGFSGLLWVISITAIFFHGKIPYMLPLSVLATLLLTITVVWSNKSKIDEIPSYFLQFIKNTWVYIFVGLLYLIAVIRSKEYDILLLKESIYIFYIWYLIALFYFLIKLHSFKENYLRLFNRIFLLFLIVLLFGFYYNLVQTASWVGKIFNSTTDYNYLSLGLLTAIPIIVYEWKRKPKFWSNFVGAVLLIAVFIPVFGSGSRRGFILAILVHFALIIFLTRSIILKKKPKILTHYFSILFLSFSFLVVFFGTASPQIRNLIVDNAFSNSQRKVKIQYTSIFYRYSSIKNDTLSFKELYDRQWTAKPFQSNSFGDKLIAKRLNAQLKKHLIDKQYDLAWKNLLNLRSFSSSQTEFLSYLPNEYRNIIPETQLLSDSIIYSPYLYPIPFTERNFFDFSKIKNVYPINPKSSELIDLHLFKAIGNKETVLESNIFLLPKTQNTIVFTFKSKQANTLDVSFLDNKKRKINIKKKCSDSLLANGLIQRKIRFISPFEYARPAILKLSMDLSTTDTLYWGANYHKRLPISQKNDKEINPKKSNNWQFKKIANHIYLKNNLSRKLNTYHNLNFQELLPINQAQKDSLKILINSKRLHKLSLRPYGNAAIPITKNTSYQSFKVNKSNASIFTSIPAISGLETNFECTIISNSKPSIRSKRYPERNPYNYSLIKSSSDIRQINDSSYTVNYKFQVKKSNSGLGALIITLPEAKKDDQFSVLNGRYTLNYISDTILNVNTFQYNFLRRMIKPVLTEKTINAVELSTEDLLQWRDSLTTNGKLLDSRIQRWKFASFYFGRFNFLKKIFGDGFNYLKVYPIIFPENGTNTGSDYPHNPIISSFLYSGIVGGFFYIYFLGLSFYRYWKLRKKLALFGILYSLAFAFTFFSGNSHFSVPAFTLLSLLPFAFPIKNKNQFKLKKEDSYENN